MANESKAERFRRIATKRTNKILHALRLLGNCSNRSTYEFTDEQVRTIFNTIDKQFTETKAKFKNTGKLEFRL